jgi:hypothetical protein
MKYYRCKCGNVTEWSSYGPSPCGWCEECNSSLADHIDMHRDTRIPHQFVAIVIDTDEGFKTLSKCSWCGKKKPQSLN